MVLKATGAPGTNDCRRTDSRQGEKLLASLRVRQRLEDQQRRVLKSLYSLLQRQADSLSPPCAVLCCAVLRCAVLC